MSKYVVKLYFCWISNLIRGIILCNSDNPNEIFVLIQRANISIENRVVCCKNDSNLEYSFLFCYFFSFVIVVIVVS